MASNQTYKQLSQWSEILKYELVFSMQKYGEFSKTTGFYPTYSPLSHLAAPSPCTNQAEFT